MLIKNSIDKGKHDDMMVDLDKINYPDPGELIDYKKRKKKEKDRKMRKAAKETEISFN